MKVLLSIFFLTILFLNAEGSEPMKIQSGKSLGEVSIGDTSEHLKKLNFAPDNSRDSMATSTTYMKKANVLVRLVGGKAVQIWINYKDLKALRFNGKKLPNHNDPESFKKFFQGCKEVQGSGGKSLYCENDGIELTFPGADGPVGFSVISPSEVKKMVGSQF